MERCHVVAGGPLRPCEWMEHNDPKAAGALRLYGRVERDKTIDSITA